MTDLDLLRAVLSEPARPFEAEVVAEERVGPAMIAIAEGWLPSEGDRRNEKTMSLSADAGYLSFDWVADEDIPGAELIDYYADVRVLPGTVVPLTEWKQDLAAACVTTVQRDGRLLATWAVGTGKGVLRVRFALDEASADDVRAVCAMVRSVRIDQAWDVLPPAWPPGEAVFCKPGKSTLYIGPAVLRVAAGWKGDQSALDAGWVVLDVPGQFPPYMLVAWHAADGGRIPNDAAALRRELSKVLGEEDTIVRELEVTYAVPCVGVVAEDDVGFRTAHWVMSDGTGVLVATLMHLDSSEALDGALKMMMGMRFERVALA